VAAAFPRLADLEREHRSLLLGLARSRRGKSAERAEAPGAASLQGALSTFEGGLETLIRALAKVLGEKVQSQTEVTSLWRAERGWRIQVSSVRSGPSSLEADRVVLALPSYAASKLIQPLDPTLASELSAIEYAPVAVVHLGYRRTDLASPPEGFGVLIPAGTELQMLGAIFVSSIFPWRADPGRVLLTCMLGGARRPQVLDADDESLIAWVREDLRRALRIEATPCFREIVRWRRAIPQYNVGHLARVRRIEEAVSRLPGLFLSGNSLHGVGINDCIRNAHRLADRMAADNQDR
jgi:oxygen-dependent protoporphyrinogen oxidase